MAIGVPHHAHHLRAQRYWREEAAEQILFCRQTSLGLLRILTAAAPMAGAPLTVGEAWATYQRLRSLPETGFIAEPDGCEAQLQEWVDLGIVTSRLWTDAYLAAFAVAGGLRLVTFDRDFARFPHLNHLLLEG